MNIKPPLQRLRDARTALILDHPFFGLLASRLHVTLETRGLTRTAATDGRSCLFDREYVGRCSDFELTALFAHEVLHVAMLHHTRRGKRDPSLWQAAADFAINPIIVDAGLTLPGRPCLEARFRGMTAEQIYAVLEEDRNDEKTAPPHAQGRGGSAPGSADDESGWVPGPDGVNAGDSGDQPTSVPDTPGAVLDAQEPAQQEAQWKVAVEQASRAAQLMGEWPGTIQFVVEKTLKPRIDWRATLRRFVQATASADYSWRMPNRRYIAAGTILPEIRSERMPAIVAAVDSSGSTESVLPVFKAELQAIVEECRPEATIVIMADAAVQRVDRFEAGDPVEFIVEGLGGTDFRPVFTYLEREQLEAACVIYLTDGYGVFPEAPFEVPTLWAMTTPDLEAPWGETMFIDSSHP